LSRGLFLKNEAFEEKSFPEENNILELTNFVVSLIFANGFIEFCLCFH
jgi:hypothetical protein